MIEKSGYIYRSLGYLSSFEEKFARCMNFNFNNINLLFEIRIII